jgi:hypothetical protein
VSQSPVRIDLRAYRVGFGDCLLLSFTYARRIDGRAERHVLIDFGTNKADPDGPKLSDVAGLIEADTHGKLDVVVATHRHRDHISGFDPAVGGDTIARLKPDAVLRPWTEVPDSAPGATGGTGGAGRRPPATATAGQRRMLDVLAAGQDFAEQLRAVPKPGRLSAAETALYGLGSLQLTNSRAMERLDELAAASRGYYLRFGDPLSLDMLPGVELSVLGPPDPDTWPAIRRQAEKSVEYWFGLGAGDPAALAARAAGEPIATEGDASTLLQPGPGRWLIDRLDDHLVRSAERLVHQLDSVLNNTSVILLAEVAGHKVLLPGDAEIENWGYALTGAPDRESIAESLRGVDLYKVGHHGSRNATPKQSLFPLLARTPPDERLAVMSTLAGFYHGANPVPNQALAGRLSVAPFKLLRTDTDGAATRAPSIHVAAVPGSPFAPAD